MELQKNIYAFASYSLFRKMSDNLAVKDIIIEFINILLIEKQYHIRKGPIDTFKIKLELKEEYGFDLPYSIVNQCLRGNKYLKRENHEYWFKNKMLNENLEDNIVIKQDTIDNEIKENTNFINSLVEYIEEKTEVELADNEYNEVINALHHYIFQDSLTLGTSHKYYDYISSYLISNESNKFMNQINSIKEGTILLYGLAYNDSPSREKKWNERVDIFIEMEVLFYLVGYNGTIYQDMVKDTLQLVEEVNANKKNIYLKYFQEVEDEINSFFETAINVFQTSGPIYTEAMSSIIENCKSTADIRDKQEEFFSILKNYNIESVESPSLIDNKEYNILSKKEVNNKEFYSEVELMSKINILRKGNKFHYLPKSKAILLTEKISIKKISEEMIQEVSNNGEKLVPYHTDLYGLSARLWYDLNKGFGKTTPQSIDIISKAKTIVSSTLDDKLKEEYDNTIEDFKSGKLTIDKAEERLSYYRAASNRPEQIDSTNIDEVISLIRTESITKRVKEIYDKKKEAANYKIEVENLKDELGSALQDMDTVRKKSEKDDKTIATLSKDVSELSDYLSNQYDEQVSKCESYANAITNLVSFSVLILTGIGVYLIFKTELIHKFEIINTVASLLFVFFGINLITFKKIRSVVYSSVYGYFYDTIDSKLKENQKVND